MSSQFTVGEVVIIRNDPLITTSEDLKALDGEEVEIIGPAQFELFDDGLLLCYAVQHPSYGPFYAAPHELRRRQPPTTGEQKILAMFEAAGKRVGVI